MTRPHVFLLVGDCLRAASVDGVTMPFTTDRADLSFPRCYAPGTWTRPTHASLYSLQSPMDHGVTRRGQVLRPDQSVLPERARTAGYTTAIFSENPTFGTGTGFHHGIDYVDDEIHRKRYPSNFSPSNHVDNLSVGSGIELLREIAGRPHRLRNSVNLLYGMVHELRGPSPVEYPHHGDRVLSHLSRFVDRVDGPSFTITNLLDTHNPHHAPPAEGAKALGVEVPGAERRALHAANDDREFVLTDRESPPDRARTHFDSWDAVFRRRRDVYRAQIRYLDALIERWFRRLDDATLDRSLVLVTGDHGQLFGEEGMAGHQTSLHPHGIHVPLFVVTPDSWGTGGDRTDTPVSLLDLANAIAGVVEGSVDSTAGFVDAVVGSGEEVHSFVDGPTWDVEELRGSYDDEAVDAVCVRKVGVVGREGMTVYESEWDDATVRRTEYELLDGSRSMVEDDPDATPPDRFGQWLREGDRVDVSARVSERLERLGYK